MSFTLFGSTVAIHTSSRALRRLLKQLYAAFLTRPRRQESDYCYTIESHAERYRIFNGSELLATDIELDKLLYVLEKDLTIDLQRRRQQWFFLHSAVLSHNGQVFAVIAPSGTGKSTLAWALCRQGFSFLSDELAPIDGATLSVQPYPRALHLKRQVEACPLPKRHLATARGFFVPVKAMPGGYETHPMRLSAVFALTFEPEVTHPSSNPLSAATAALNIYANALNPLAHQNKGLASAAQLANAVPCYSLTSTTDLAATGATIKNCLN